LSDKQRIGVAQGKVKIGIVAPASRIEPELAERITAIAAAQFGARAPELFFHPQCYLSSGHFAGEDAARAEAFVELANNPSFDALWIARGGYGSGRIVSLVLPRLHEAARNKLYLGYSDAGALLAALYANGFGNLAHGPMPADLLRENGETAVRRALSFVVDRDPATLEPSVTGAEPTAAFNITILCHLMSTPYEPDLTDHVLMLEEVSEHMYRIDRSLLHLTSCDSIRRVAGIRLGRCSAIPDNEPEFVKNEEDIAQHWCEVSGIPYLGRADIGHDVDNKVVPFGRLAAR
jgi:muramoyltetrapeptide carboxypeptidase